MSKFNPQIATKPVENLRTVALMEDEAFVNSPLHFVDIVWRWPRGVYGDIHRNEKAPLCANAYKPVCNRENY